MILNDPLEPSLLHVSLEILPENMLYSMPFKLSKDRRGSALRGDGFALVASDDEQTLSGSLVEGRGMGPGASDSREHLSSDKRTFVNLLISFVGAGILGIPFAFRQVKDNRSAVRFRCLYKCFNVLWMDNPVQRCIVSGSNGCPRIEGSERPE